MSELFTTIKIWAKTRRLLRQIAALTDESMVEVLDRLAVAELQRIQDPKVSDASHANLPLPPAAS